MGEQSTDGEQAFWNASYLVALAAYMADTTRTESAIVGLSASVANKSLAASRENIVARSPEAEPAKPAKVKRAAKRLPCPGGSEQRLAPGYDKCPECGRIVGTVKGRAGWYVAEHKLPAEVG